MDSEAHNTLLPSVSAPEAGSKFSANDNHVLKNVHQFYFVKLHAYENRHLIEAENLIRKLEQDRILTNQKREEKLAYRNKLHRSLNRMHYDYGDILDRRVSKLKFLKLSFDKLCFANNSSRGKAIKPSTTVKEIDRHSLHFGLLHASKNVAKERGILSKIKEVKEMSSKHPCMSMEDYDDKIRSVQQEIYWNFNMNADEKMQIRLKIEKIEQEKEEAIATAALGGKMWNSLDAKKTIKEQIDSLDGDSIMRSEHTKRKANVIFLHKELKEVEDDLTSLEEQLNDIGRLKYEARECISKWRMEQDEKNTGYDQYAKLMRNAQELAERKELVALRKLSHEEVEKFMSQWNNDEGFRNDYRTRSIDSLNKRSLNIDGRRRNGDEKPIFVKDPTAKMSKGLKKALQIKAPERNCRKTYVT